MAYRGAHHLVFLGPFEHSALLPVRGESSLPERTWPGPWTRRSGRCPCRAHVAGTVGRPDRALDPRQRSGRPGAARVGAVRAAVVTGADDSVPPLDTFAWIPDLEDDWPTIRAELDQVLSYRDDLPNFQDISVDQASITDDDGWKTYFFFGYGFRSEANCARCPQTAALLERSPG